MAAAGERAGLLCGFRGREDGLVRIRDRLQGDRPSLERLARVIHDRDGYPLYLPTDLQGFLVSSDAYGAWVAEQDGELLGHVALHERSWDGVMEVGRRETGLSDDGLAVIARLLVSPSARRRGVGRALLQTATREAWDRGLCPILDVAVTYQAANRLYEAEGWRRLGTVRFPMPGGHAVDEHVYVAPTEVRDPPGPGPVRGTVT